MERLTREGVSLCFEEAGTGAPPILLIHDLGRDHTSLQAQLEHFRGCHRVVAVDLLGHGQSDRLLKAYTVASFAEDLAWLCYELGLYRPVAVGHGFGGLIANELAASRPDLLAAVVALDAPIVPLPETRAYMDDVLAEFHAAPDPEAARKLVRLPVPSADGLHRAALAATLAASAPLAATWANVLACDGAEALTRCNVPLLYVQARLVCADAGRLAKFCPSIVVEDVGRAHFEEREANERLNAVIDAFLQASLASSINRD